MTQYFNRTGEKHKRRLLRNNLPKAEVFIWSKIKGKQVSGYKFWRQYSIDRYVVDFYCPELKLAIEIDGDSHFQDGADASDKIRQSFIESFGISFLRFTNEDVYNNLDGVLETIGQEVVKLGGRLDPL